MAQITPKKFQPITFSQSWDNGGQNFFLVEISYLSTCFARIGMKWIETQEMTHKCLQLLQWSTLQRRNISKRGNNPPSFRFDTLLLPFICKKIFEQPITSFWGKNFSGHDWHVGPISNFSGHVGYVGPISGTIQLTDAQFFNV